MEATFFLRSTRGGASSFRCGCAGDGNKIWRPESREDTRTSIADRLFDDDVVIASRAKRTTSAVRDRRVSLALDARHGSFTPARERILPTVCLEAPVATIYRCEARRGESRARDGTAGIFPRQHSKATPSRSETGICSLLSAPTRGIYRRAEVRPSSVETRALALLRYTYASERRRRPHRAVHVAPGVRSQRPPRDDVLHWVLLGVQYRNTCSAKIAVPCPPARTRASHRPCGKETARHSRRANCGSDQLARSGTNRAKKKRGELYRFRLPGM